MVAFQLEEPQFVAPGEETTQKPARDPSIGERGSNS
jgi:hypothetical protein